MRRRAMIKAAAFNSNRSSRLDLAQLLKKAGLYHRARAAGAATGPADEPHPPPGRLAWRRLRRRAEPRRTPRRGRFQPATQRLDRRFRHDPAGYLQRLEESLIKPALPPLIFLLTTRQGRE